MNRQMLANGVSHRAPLAFAKSGVGLVFGLAIAFAGYRLARGFAAIAGFLIGFSLGLLIGIPGGPAVSFGVAIVVGILFALVFRFAFRFVGGVLGGSIGAAIATSLAWPWWGAVLALVIGALVGIFLNKLVIVVATGLMGGWLATRSAFELLHDLAGFDIPWDREVVGIITTLIIAALGAASQWRTLRAEG